MRVLMFGWEFPPHITGGLGTACFGLTKGLMKQGVEVLFVVPKAYGDENEEAVRIVNASNIPVNIHEDIYKDYWKNISYIEVNSKIIPYCSLDEYYRLINCNEHTGTEHLQSLLSKNYNFKGGYGTNLMEEVERYAMVAASIAKDYDFDIIHAHDWLTYKAGIEARRISGKPLVIHVHATEFDRTGENVNDIVYGIEKYGMEQADRIIAVSNLTRNTVIHKYGINPNKVQTVYNGVEPIEREPLNEQKVFKEKIVTFLGRVTFQKGPDYFIEAAHRVLQHDNNVRFVMAGSGDMLTKMINRVAQLKISDKFHFTGFLKGDDVNRMFEMSDVYVMPSVSEPFGISPLEAMRSNVPVIVSKQSGVSEILKYAIKVDFWDIDAMADAIYGLLHYPALFNTFITKGKEEVDSINWDDAAEKVKQQYDLTLA